MPKITQLPTASSVATTDLVPVVVGSVTQQATVGQVRGATVTETVHFPLVTPSDADSASTFNADGALLTQEFEVGLDATWSRFRVPAGYQSGGTMHFHWTKSGDANESGKFVKWQLSYLVFDGAAEDGAAAPTVVAVEDSYDDNGTTTRIVYQSSDVTISGLVAGKYVAVKIEAVAPAANPMASNPALFAADIVWTQKVFG
jgi:hypothetical protein